MAAEAEMTGGCRVQRNSENCAAGGAKCGYWANDWREAGLAGLAEGPHAGRPRQLDEAAEATLEHVLADDPQVHGYAATDWTVPLLRTELVRRGHDLSERTLRRTLHRLGCRWQPPKYVLGRPGPASEAKKGP